MRRTLLGSPCGRSRILSSRQVAHPFITRTNALKTCRLDSGLEQQFRMSQNGDGDDCLILHIITTTATAIATATTLATAATLASVIITTTIAIITKGLISAL